MVTIIRHLIMINQLLLAQIQFLSDFISKKLDPPKDRHEDAKYRKMTIDKPPKLVTIQKLDFQKILVAHEWATGKQLSPVKRRKPSTVPVKSVCPRCGAPHGYLYDNDGGRGQLACKVCGTCFSRDGVSFKSFRILCPYCGRVLDLKHRRKAFNVHACPNQQCPYYLNALAALSAADRAEYREHPYRFKLRYRYREFLVNFFKMDLYSLPKGAASLQFRKFSPHVMGLCLTYLVNCNLSTRVTARILKEVHQVSISHTQVASYAKTAALVLKPFVDGYDYQPSFSLVADETYIRIRGVQSYVWFVLDGVKRSILGYTVSSSRDLTACMKALRMAFDKFGAFPNHMVQLVSDGYPVYQLAQIEFFKNNKFFELVQVFGLTNDDPISTAFRPFKQLVERFNRIFKSAYRITGGYKSDVGSDIHVALFVAFYNFLRPHGANRHQPLHSLPQLEGLETMPAKWQHLILMAQQQLLQDQSSA